MSLYNRMLMRQKVEVSSIGSLVESLPVMREFEWPLGSRAPCLYFSTTLQMCA